jgi:hypothetical protein
VNININCDQRLYSRISNYLNFFYAGDLRPHVKPLTYHLSIRRDPPAVPLNAVKTLKASDMTCYRNETDSYYTLKNGSIIHFNPIIRRAEGFIKKESLTDLAGLLSLIGAPISENLKYNSLYSFHSAALLSNGVGYLLSGDSGSGKTTSTLNLISAGYKYVSDDVVLLEEVNGEIIAHSLAKTINVDRDLAGRFPDILNKENLPADTGVKMSLDITQLIPDSFIPHLRPDVIIFIKKNLDGNSRILPLSQTEVYSRLLKQTVLATNKEVSRNQLQAYGKLVRQVRGFELLNGRDIYEHPENLVHLMNRMGCHNADN